ncbi:MAG: modA [Firmicutes bacterium]|nr:modA [Bacillota bacterium]
MRRYGMALCGALLALSLTACSAAPKPTAQQAPTEVVVSAAASLADVMKPLQSGFEADNPTIKLRFNFGSSGSLQQQIEQGAPVDLFISAATAPMDAIVAKQLVSQSAVKQLAGNKVVLIRPKSDANGITTWTQLTDSQVKHIALGNPQHVPAGQYGKAVLEKLGLWDRVQGHLILGEDVRQVLNYVESGEVQAGLVYSTDAAQSQKVVVVAEAPAGSHPPVVYPMAVLKDAQHAAQAEAFASYLLSPKGQQVLRQYGFTGGV